MQDVSFNLWYFKVAKPREQVRSKTYQLAFQFVLIKCLT